AHENYGKGRVFSRLDESNGFGELIQSAKASREDHIGRGILDQHHFPHKEVIKSDSFREVRIRLLLMGKEDITADAFSSVLKSAAVRGFHDARATARHHRIAFFREQGAELSRFGISRVIFRESCGAEYRYGGADTMQAA